MRRRGRWAGKFRRVLGRVKPCTGMPAVSVFSAASSPAAAANSSSCNFQLIEQALAALRARATQLGRSAGSKGLCGILVSGLDSPKRHNHCATVLAPLRHSTMNSCGWEIALPLPRHGE